MEKRPYVLSIAGFDPSAGAGVLADIKTFEAFKTLGLGVSTAITYQTEDQFLGVDWLSSSQIRQQLKPLLKKYPIEVVKIGLLENVERLQELTEILNEYRPAIKIIWDPILKASAGFTFHEQISKGAIEKIAPGLFMITPNWEEITQLYPELHPKEGAAHLSRFCKVYLKGGHDTVNRGRDLFFENGKVRPYKTKVWSAYSKHGSGCILSAAITAAIARGYPLNKANLKAKGYVTSVLSSNKTLLGYHKL